MIKNPLSTDWYRKARARIEESLQTPDGKKHPLADVLLAAPDLIHLTAKLLGDERVPLKQKALLAGALGYFLSPIDLLPAALLGPIGLMDDIALAAFALNSLLNEVDPSILREHWTGSEDVLRVIRQVLGRTNQTLGGAGGLWSRMSRRFRKTA